MTDIEMFRIKCAFNRWRFVDQDEPSWVNVYQQQLYYFRLFLGIPALCIPVRNGNDRINLPDEAVRKIHLLNGPHWFATIKAYHAIRRANLNPDQSQQEKGGNDALGV